MNMNFFFILICTLISVSVQAECVRLTKDVRAKTQPDKIWVSFKKDDMFKVIKKSPDGKKVYAVKGTQKAVFLMTAVSEELCLHSVTANPVAPPPPPELTIKKPLVQPAEPSAVKPDSAPSPSLWSNVRWGAEYQMHANTSSANYRGLITTIPDASDVSSLQDPIIVDINRGAGSMLGLTGEYRYSDKIDLDARFGLRKLTYKYQQKANPGLSPVALNGLPTSEKSFDISHYVFGFGFKYFYSELPDQNLRFFAGAQAQILYANSSEIVINALVGNLFKNTPTTVSVKVDTISSDGLMNFGLQWNRFNLSLGVTPYLAYVISLGGSISF